MLARTDMDIAEDVEYFVDRAPPPRVLEDFARDYAREIAAHFFASDYPRLAREISAFAWGLYGLPSWLGITVIFYALGALPPTPQPAFNHLQNAVDLLCFAGLHHHVLGLAQILHWHSVRAVVGPGGQFVAWMYTRGSAM